jgi:hypothetical protein
VVLVFGGSQGAKAVNDAIAAWCARGLPIGVALIWATGRAQAPAYVQHESAMVRVRPYLSPIGDAYAAADLAVTRAGAMSIAELCAWGIPSVLVPLPTAAQDHQAHNATAGRSERRRDPFARSATQRLSGSNRSSTSCVHTPDRLRFHASRCSCSGRSRMRLRTLPMPWLNFWLRASITIEVSRKYAQTAKA